MRFSKTKQNSVQSIELGVAIFIFIQLMQDVGVVDASVQLRKISKALNVQELRPAIGNGEWQKEVCILKMAATEWKIKTALLQAQGLVLRANNLTDVISGK